MLSQHDRRVLADIEAHLRAGDPDLAHELEHAPFSAPPRAKRPRLRAGLAGLVLGLIMLAAAFAAHSADVAVSAVIVLAMVATGVTLHVASRFKRGPLNT